VGAGGAGYSPSVDLRDGNAGTQSSFGSNIIAYGGSGSTANSKVGATSGGTSIDGVVTTGNTGGTGTALYGTCTTGGCGVGGGGGAGGAGGVLNGGAGVSNSITGSAVSYGGGGAGRDASSAGTSSGGGGSATTNNFVGVTNTGGGGADGGTFAGSGGSGIVVISYANTLTINSGAGVVSLNTVSKAAALSINTSSLTSSVSGIISDFAQLNKLGSGKLSLTAANTYSGPTSITGGTLILSSSGTLGNTYIASYYYGRDL
jgi:hypothetical protein